MILYRNLITLRSLLCACATLLASSADSQVDLSVECSKGSTEAVKTSQKLVESKKLPEAELCLRQGLKKTPSNRDLGFYLIRVIAWQKRYDDAKIELKKWKDTDSEHLSLLGDIYWYEGNSAQASRAYSASLKKRTSPSWPEGLWQRSVNSSISAGYTKRAKFFLRRYKSEYPDSEKAKELQRNYLAKSSTQTITADIKLRTESHTEAEKPGVRNTRNSTEYLLKWTKKLTNSSPSIAVDYIEKNFGNEINKSDAHLELGYLFDVASLNATSEIIVAAGPTAEFTYRYFAEAGLGYGFTDSLKTESRLRQTLYEDDSALLFIAGVTNYSGPMTLIIRIYRGQSAQATNSLLTRLLYQIGKIELSALVAFGNEDASRPEPSISSSNFYTAGLGIKFQLNTSIALASLFEYRAEVDQKDFSQSTGGASAIWTF